MSVQRTDWGEVRWLDAADLNDAANHLRVGLVTLGPRQCQPVHVHYDEQVLYVLEGHAESTVDGKSERLVAGSLLHLPAGISHEIVNVQDAPFRHVLVSNPAPAAFAGGVEMDGAYARSASGALQDGPADAHGQPSDLIYLAVEAVRTQFLETLPFGYALFDQLGNLLLQGKHFPEYCQASCSVDACPGEADCMLKGRLLDASKAHTLRCEYGMEVYQYPIMHDKCVIGYLQAGYIRRSDADPRPGSNVYDSPESVVDGVKALMSRIVKAIQNYCEFEQFRQELSRRDSQIANAQEQEDILLQDLQAARYAITDLRINSHFLFNALNGMASMALDGGQLALYQSIVDLSKMFHYTLRTQSAIVPLRKEIEYMRAYLQLQKVRYGDQLHTQISVDPLAAGQPVPFNFLQPIVENAFVHGFHDDGQKELLVEARLQHDLVIRVTNSGATLSESEYRFVNQGVRSNTSHGLSMVYAKLQGMYGNKSEITFAPAKWYKGGTSVTTVIPIADRHVTAEEVAH
ncbi:MAG: histidine kinase [Eggerthellaceae bacterium]|nr:histidine kinase [Eggerthellaceae bacterium]